MATNYPGALDSYATLLDNVDDVLAAHANDRGDAIRALQAKLGVDSSAVATAIDYFLKHASGAYRTHFHDGTSDDGTKLDWDLCWLDAVHTHISNAEGGVLNSAGAVDGAALTGLASIPAGAGNIPASNLGLAVLLSGNQTIADIKTFSSILVLPASDPTTDNQASRKKYVDDNVGKVGTKTVDEAAIANLKYLQYKTASGKLEYVTVDTTPADGSISQAKLKTATGAVSVIDTSDGYTYALLNLPGGGYGFYPRFKLSNVSSTNNNYTYGCALNFIQTDGLILNNNAPGGETSYYTYIYLGAKRGTATTSGTMYADQRYITASGKDHWIFLLVDKITKQVIASYQAPDHPSANQGGATELEIPHPFGSYDPDKHEIVIVDNDILKDLKSKINRKSSLLTLINEQCIIDDTKRPKYEAREIVKINEFPDDPIGIVKARIKTPQWAKIMIGAEDITLEQRMVEQLPANILFKKLTLK